MILTIKPRSEIATVSAPPLRYYADIRQTISASDQEMNSALAELSRVRNRLVSPFCCENV